MSSKPSDLKPVYVLELERARNVLADAAAFGSTADAALVELAAKGFRFAAQWTKSTTVTDQYIVANTGRAIESAALRSVSKGKLTLAIAAYGRALALFAACEYKGAAKNCAMVDAILNP